MAKYTYDLKHKIDRERERERERETERENKTWTTPKQGGYLIGGNYFQKSIHVRCLKRFWSRCCLVNHRNNQTT